jgi:adenylate cyclase
VARKSYRLRRAVIAAIIGSLCLVAAIGTAVNLRWFSARENGLPPRLSIVVLPFKNLSNDPEQQYFVDGITEDVTTDLSRIVDLFVIAPSTAFSYREKSVDTRQIGRELSVHYVLEGSVQRLGNEIRINTQLTDAETSLQLWADRFAYESIDLLTLQNELTHRIANSLSVTLIRTEAARPTTNPSVLDYILRARATLQRPFTRATVGEAIKFLEQALTLDPNSVEAKLWLAEALATNVLNDGSDTRDTDIARADALIGQALASEPDNTLAHVIKGDVLRAQARWKEAAQEFELVVTNHPNWDEAWHGLGQCKLFMGAIDEVIPVEQRSIKLSPLGPNIAFKLTRIGFVYLLKSQIQEAIEWLEKARNSNPTISFLRGYLVSAYALNGEPERAAAELEQRQKMSLPLQSIARYRTRQETGLRASPKLIALEEETFFAGLRKAGLPEE